MRLRAVFCLAFLLTSCARQSDEKKLLKAMSAPKSWLATLPFLAEQRLGNRVPEAFTLDCLEAAKKEIEKGTKAIRKSSASPELRARLQRELDRARQSVAALQRALAMMDRASVRRESDRCSSIEEQIDSLEKGYEGQS
jgi:hypothetical protein